jgi:hypothetical protein
MTAAELVLGLGYELAITRGRPELRAETGFLVRVVIAASVACVPVFVLGLPSLVEAIVGAAVYLSVAFLLRLVPRELYDAFRSLRLRTPGGVVK